MVEESTFLSGCGLKARQLDIPNFLEDCSGAWLYLGQGNRALEVCVYDVNVIPSHETLRKVWKERQGKRGIQLLTVTQLPDGEIRLSGPTEDTLSVRVLKRKNNESAKKVCAEALEKKDRHAVFDFLKRRLPLLGKSAIHNEGMLSDHAIKTTLKHWQSEKGWKQINDQTRDMLKDRPMGEALLQKLGFTVETIDSMTHVLKSKDGRTALAIMLKEGELPESESPRFNNLSPISYALAKADEELLPWVIVTQGQDLRLYATDNCGVARRGRTESYIACYTTLLSKEDAGLLWQLFSADALKKQGNFDQILDNSRRFADALAKNLRERIYDTVMPRLALGIVEARKLSNPTNEELSLTYDMALTVLFRLLFIAYAEGRDLLPYDSNNAYSTRSLTSKALQLAENNPSGDVGEGEGEGSPHQFTHHWEETKHLWEAFSKGKSEWDIPAYNGAMFSSDESESPAGAALARISLPDSVFEDILRSLLLVEEPYKGPVDFRSLSVREFGTIYEGLLESELSLARQNLAIKKSKKQDQYVPYVPSDVPSDGPSDVPSDGLTDNGAKGKRGLTDKSGAKGKRGAKDKSDGIAVHKGEIYLHDRSGARKSSGSYYTPDFIVDHLLDKALEPALKKHLAALEKLSDTIKRADGKHDQVFDDVTAAERFFDFRVADISMGSGHFLVAVIDRIEKRFSAWLLTHPLPGIRLELAKLRTAAYRSLKQNKTFHQGESGQGESSHGESGQGESGHGESGQDNSGQDKSGQGESGQDKSGDSKIPFPIEDSALLRRMIARRCIYGVDINPLAVKLARMSIWIHTFVPGLPLSLLDRNLVCGDALLGIGSVREIRDVFRAAGLPLFKVDSEKMLGAAAKPLKELGKLYDATIDDIRREKELIAEVEEKTSQTRALCDLIIARRISDNAKLRGFDFGNWEEEKETIFDNPIYHHAREKIAAVNVVHFPVAFPEVFLGAYGSFDDAGFHVILGNPPWDNVKIEEHGFWARHFPGMRSLPQREFEAKKKTLYQERPDLVKNLEKEKHVGDVKRAMLSAKIFPDADDKLFPGMGTGDADLYKAFAWKFWRLAHGVNGWIGVVLPRSILNSKGSEEWRREVIPGAKVDVATLLNSGRWAFDMEPRYTIALTVINKGREVQMGVKMELKLGGPFNSLDAFRKGKDQSSPSFTMDDVMAWSNTMALPMMPDPDSADVLRQLRQSTRFDYDDENSWRARPCSEMHSTNDKHRMDMTSKTCPDGFWPVYKGESYDLWQPDRGKYYGYGDPAKILPWLQKKRLNSQKMKNGVYCEFTAKHVEDESTLENHHPRIVFRNIASATNSRTVVVALCPPKVFHQDTAPILLWPRRKDRKDEAYLLGLLSSIPLDWYARRFVELHLNFHIFNSLPIPRIWRDDMLWRRVVALAGRLACPDQRFASWAKDVEVEWGPLDNADKQDKIYELDAVVAHVYRLERSQLIHIFETFHTGWDYTDRLKAVLKHYGAWSKKIKEPMRIARAEAKAKAKVKDHG